MSDEKRRDRTASLKHEREYYRAGYRYIFGMDEAGRGPWAGPIAVGAVCLPLERRDITALLKGIKDSKQMTPLQRVKAADTIKAAALAWGTGMASAAEINDLGLTQATKLAMQRALEMALHEKNFQPDCLFVDYMAWPEKRDITQLSIVSGDKYSLSIAAASVLAKTWRDAAMRELHEKFPQYGFKDNKGYGTAAHRAALEQYGACPEHRLNYAPVRAILQKRGNVS